ncbi:MAG: hypothetical protein ICV60_24140 [Pyrinomonadaceae bacterium]|nr:hypothetical protein [Pyrinomonadaceae bacterium]
MSAIKQEAQPLARKREAGLQIPWKRIGIYVGIIVAVFLLGLVPMWLKAREYAGQRDAAQRELRLSQLENSLSESTIDARRGEYEPARQMASDFFTSLRTQMDKGEASDLTGAQRESLKGLLAERDETITLLARSDPAAADRLSDLYIAFRDVMSSVPPQGGR